MARQNIYGTISDDIVGQSGHTSSLRGKVCRIDVWINTDTSGDSKLSFFYDKEKKNVIVTGYMPKKWEHNIALNQVV
jgi:hypothetical protein